MASGLTLIFGVMRVINVAHGAFLILAAYCTYWLFQLTGLDPIISIILTAPLLFILGWFIQRYVLSHRTGRFGDYHLLWLTPKV
jgi:branched-chain amino acid transport system permease protein